MEAILLKVIICDFFMQVSDFSNDLTPDTILGDFESVSLKCHSVTDF